MGRSKGGHKKEVHINLGFPKEGRDVSNKLIFHLRELEKEQQIKPKTSRIREIINIRIEINDTDIKKEHINETRNWFFEIILKNDNPLA